MAFEIERKFLVINDNWRASIVDSRAVQQGYLSKTERASVRVRLLDERGYLTIKSRVEGIRRHEFEYEIPAADARTLLESIALRPFIQKTRHRVRCGDHLWDLDVFEGENAGLVVAEVELDHEGEAFERPDWVGDEVSDDPRYLNSNLVSHPYRRW